MPAALLPALSVAPVVPLIEAHDTGTAVAVARALRDGGIGVVEVVQRTDAALDCLEAIAEALPDLLTGAGTVLSGRQGEACIARGARFLVSPGLDTGVVESARAGHVEVMPGVLTPTETQHAHNLGLLLLKFFPATAAGGPATLGALASVFRDARFVPTGGVTAANLADFMAMPSVVACGGSWLTPRDAVSAGDFERVSDLAREALAVARAVKQETSRA